MSALKFAEGGIIEGIAAPYGSPQRRDAHGEFFDAQTDFALDLIPAGRPLLLDHGLGAAGPEVVGRIMAVERRPEGLWIRAQLDRAGRYFGKIRDGLAKGALSFSSATLAHLAQVAPDGRIIKWPFVEASLTDHPASQDARIVSVRSAISHFGEIGQPASALKSLVFGGREPSPEEIAYAHALAKVDRIEARVAAAQAYAEYEAIGARLDRRFGRSN